ncbi:hypothetical protein [Xanthomonas hortorum]|uniref:hypothetical protein n=1 Tax=Xanthomonas hortorum TaxID=56454 RepID=UPI0021149435|nr:hypothetical protein [Xanthomonas hortorum]UUF04823.1 hypothetical protein NDY25_22305 [Xanthomonas hortorum pv. pelargonii]
MRIEYSHHCFSQDPDKLETYDPEHLYLWEARPNDPRVFCPTRWEASKLLPGLVENLDERNCYPTRRDNYFAVKRDLPSGHYVLYFRAERKLTGGADVRLFVESAYHRDDMDDVIANAEKPASWTSCSKPRQQKTHSRRAFVSGAVGRAGIS